MALWLGFLAFTAVGGIQSLVVELRSSTRHGKKKKKKKDTVRRIKDKPSNRRKYFLSMHLIKNFYCKYMRNSQNSILRKPIFLNGQKIYFFNGQRF